MTIEEEIDKIVPRFSMRARWRGYPTSQSGYTTYMTSPWKEIEALIEEASLEECLTSPSEYVREYKKFLLETRRDL